MSARLEEGAPSGAAFQDCQRHDDPEGAVAFDCGLYLYEARLLPEIRPHDEVVDARVAETLAGPLPGELEGKKKLDPIKWDGQDVEISLASYKARPETIEQPYIEVYVTQEVDGRMQVFKCWHTLAMSTSEEEVASRIARCRDQLQKLVVWAR